MQHNYRKCYLVLIDSSNKQTSSTESNIINVENFDPDVYVYRLKKCKFESPFLSFKPKHVSIGKSKVCAMTHFSGAVNNTSDFDGNTLLLQCENNEYVCIFGLENCKFKTDDKIIDYISLIGNNMVPYAFILGEKYTYFYTIVINLLKTTKLKKELY